MAQYRIHSQSSSEYEMQKWSWYAEWYNRPPSLSHWLWLGWWSVSFIPDIVCLMFNILLTGSVMGSVRVPSIFLKITSYAVFILMERGILTMLRKGSSEVAYLSRFALSCLHPSCAYRSLHSTRHILIYSYHLHHLNPSLMKMKMVLQGNNNALLIHRGKQPSVTLQTSLAWMARWLHAWLPMLLFWYVFNPDFCSIISYHCPLPLSLPLISLMLPTGWKSIITSIFVHYMHWLLTSSRFHVVQQHRNDLKIYSSGGARTWLNLNLCQWTWLIIWHFRQTNIPPP